VSEPRDPERLLSEALRAQAVRAPLADPARQAHEADSVLRLFSGTDAQPDLLSGRASDTSALDPRSTPAGPPYTPRIAQAPTPLSAWWIVLLAVLLGLAAGAVVGLVSLL
jgi:hypothetical protein